MAAESNRVSGWLLKRGGLRKSWKRRWFVLEGTTVSYFKTTDETVSPAGTIDLTAYGAAGGVVAFVDPADHGKPHEFSVGGEGERTYFMAAPTASVRYFERERVCVCVCMTVCV